MDFQSLFNFLLFLFDSFLRNLLLFLLHESPDDSLLHRCMRLLLLLDVSSFKQLGNVQGKRLLGSCVGVVEGCINFGLHVLLGCVFAEGLEDGVGFLLRDYWLLLGLGARDLGFD